MNGPDTGFVALFVPLTFTVIIELSNATREEEKIEDLVGDPPFLPKSRIYPQFSRLNFIHATNIVLFCACLSLALWLDNSVVRNLLSFLVIVVWLVLPVLELNEYHEYPLSLLFHFASVIGISSIVWLEHHAILKMFTRPSHALFGLDSTILVSLSVILVFLFFGWFTYLHLLKWEVNNDEAYRNLLKIVMRNGKK